MLMCHHVITGDGKTEEKTDDDDVVEVKTEKPAPEVVEIEDEDDTVTDVKTAGTTYCI